MIGKGRRDGHRSQVRSSSSRMRGSFFLILKKPAVAGSEPYSFADCIEPARKYSRLLLLTDRSVTFLS
ncbi:hypothetical protein B6V72_13835 [Thioclava sp. F34-6]|nr:hypothetical protein B6V72_13835 [Thioclava sp. F34-6]